MRLATLVGKDLSGKWDTLGIAEGNDVDKLVAQYGEITAALGKIGKGKSETRLSQIRLLSTDTAGGELKAKRVFV